MRKSRRARLLIRGALLFAVLLLVLAGGGYHLLRGSLAAIDGRHALVGLSADATIARDAAGVATIDAGSAADAARALGFVHAQERYFEMDLLRRSASGELSALFGPAAVERDREVRVHRMRSRMQQALAAMPAAQRELLDAYAEGVVAGLDGLRSRPWPYLLLRQPPTAWRAEDSLLVAAAMAFDLHDESNRREYMFGRLERYLSDELMQVLRSDGSDWDAPLFGMPRSKVELPSTPWRDRDTAAAGEHSTRSGSPRGSTGNAPMEEGNGVGSNNFAVAGNLTRDGRAILANDMHLGLRAPNIWFRARLRYPDQRASNGRVDVSGVSLPGVPGVVAGSNGHVAWGFTNSYGDWLDWFRVQWIDRDTGRYAIPGGAESVQRFHEVIRVAGGEDQVLEVRETRWGPILHDDDDGSGALALAWTIHRAGGINLGLADMALAETLEQAIAIGQRTGMPAQNLLVAAADGRIGWTIAGRIPQRRGDCDPQRTLDPLAGCDWADGWLDAPAELRLLDPGDGRLWTANSRVVDGEALRLVGVGGYDLGARQRQIRDALRARDQFTEGGLLAIQLDDRALFLQRWWQLMRKVAAGDPRPELQRLQQASVTWEGVASVEAVSYRLARGFRAKVIERLTDRLLADARAAEGARWQPTVLTQIEGLAWQLLQQRPDGWVGDAPDAWDRLLADAAIDLVRDLEQSGALVERSWGERNAARICHPLAGALPSPLASLLCQSADPLPGDSNMPRVQGPTFGASQRMAVAPGHEADGILHAPAGQSGHPLSPFWSAGHADWVDGRGSPFLPGPTRHRLILQPTVVR